MPFAQMKMFLEERSRSAREAHNMRQALFKLPAEIRNSIFSLALGGDHYIFEHGLFRQESSTFNRFAGARNVYHRSGRWYSQVSIPALFQVCGQMRREYMGILFGAATLVVWLVHAETREKRSGRHAIHKWCVDFLDDSGIAALRFIEVRSDYECQGHHHRVVSAHYKGQSVTAQGSVKITVDRRTGNIDVVPMYKEAHDRYIGASTEVYGGLVVNVKNLYPKLEEVYDCCRETSRKTLERLLANMQALDMNNSNHRLCKDDLWELRRLMGGKLWDKPVVEFQQRNGKWRWFWRGRDHKTQVRCHTTNRCHL